MAKVVGIGKQRFDKIVENNCFYIDKTMFIKEWWENQDDVTLITRPRRFGKTLNMDMVKCFFSIDYKNRVDLFEKFDIWKEEKYRELQGTYPVIFLSFADIKQNNYNDAVEKMKRIICDICQQFEFLKDWDGLTENERENASGYLCVVKLRVEGELRKKIYTLKITNKEVQMMFESMIEEWFDNGNDSNENFIEAMLVGDLYAMNSYMNDIELIKRGVKKENIRHYGFAFRGREVLIG